MLVWLRVRWYLNTAKKELRKKVETLVLCWGSSGRIASCLVLGKLVTGRREEGIARESRNMLDDLCQIGLRGVWDNLVSEHREEGIAKSSRNLSDGLWRGGLGWIRTLLVGYE